MCSSGWYFTFFLDKQNWFKWTPFGLTAHFMVWFMKWSHHSLPSKGNESELKCAMEWNFSYLWAPLVIISYTWQSLNKHSQNLIEFQYTAVLSQLSHLSYQSRLVLPEIWKCYKGRKYMVQVSYQCFLTCIITEFRTFTKSCPREGIINIQLIFSRHMN